MALIYWIPSKLFSKAQKNNTNWMRYCCICFERSRNLVRINLYHPQEWRIVLFYAFLPSSRAITRIKNPLFHAVVNFLCVYSFHWRTYFVFGALWAVLYLNVSTPSHFHLIIYYLRTIIHEEPMFFLFRTILCWQIRYTIYFSLQSFLMRITFYHIIRWLQWVQFVLVRFHRLN